jgi:osmotically-inducible protein OsmY
MNKIRQFVLLLTLTGLLSGCGGLVVTGAATGALTVHDRRSAATVLQDQEIELKAFSLLGDHKDISENSNISVTSYNMKVLLSGQASSAALSQRFAELVARIPRVEKVYNEVVIGAESTWSDAASDTYLTGKVKVKLLDVELKDFDPTRVKVVTSKSTVFLMGLLTRQEADAVTDTVRYVSGVEKVVRLFEYIQPQP